MRMFVMSPGEASLAALTVPALAGQTAAANQGPIVPAAHKTAPQTFSLAAAAI